MIRSMTGFGKAERPSAEGLITVEIRTLNHKFFEMMARLPSNLSELEDKLRDILQQKIRRGRVHISVSVDLAGAGAPIAINTTIAKKYRRMLNELKVTLKVKDDIRLSHIITLPNVIECERPASTPVKVWQDLKKALIAALANLVRAREREGRILYKDIMHHLKRMGKSIETIKRLTPPVLVRYREGLFKKTQYLLNTKNVDVERLRLEEEVARFARDCDISEELTRLSCHLGAFKEALGSKEEVGRRLDFITQELHREANTIAAKANDYKIQEEVIDIKSAIEKIREQVQNVE